MNTSIQNTLNQVETTDFAKQSLSDIIQKFDSADHDAPEFKTNAASFAKVCSDMVATFIGNHAKQWELVSRPAAYALADVVIFHNNNNAGKLWYSLLDPVSNMGNKTMAISFAQIAYDLFGIELRLKKAETVKENDYPWVAKNRKANPLKGILAPQDMNRESMIQAIKLLEQGGFKQLVESVRSEREGNKPLSEEKPLVLTKDQKTDPNCIKALELAKTLYAAKQAATQGLSDIRIEELALDLKKLLARAEEVKLDILKELAKSQAKVMQEDQAA
jgi:hypothetical protein